ncbi:DUF3857 domain-containing protein [Tenacibaculum aiptasiae]|uniref:DUF3857 domain-containing protein n=1 Tax=Tenacibaculum aiptasiae TaxID=426481 RepID=A0A7J5A9W7_9FLAO|nr:DUF3857 domain-containing protein [Tenacibaculum aiptasiae]KAB1153949.1 DUF3857 domain-containing protein [Tenacibaculum aiptasiae]
MKKLLFILALMLSLKTTAQKVQFGKVSKEELEEKLYPSDSTIDATYLYKKRRTYFSYNINTGFKVITEYHERIKIYTKEGFDYANKKINYYHPITGDKESINHIKAYTFNLENGKIEKHKLLKKNIFEERLNKYRKQKKIAFPNIKKGSVIELKYTLTSPHWDIRTVNFQYKIPIKKLDINVVIPEYFIFNKISKGYYSVPLVESQKNGQISLGVNNKVSHNSTEYSFKQKNVPAINDNEPFSGYIDNYRGGIKFELSGTRFPNSFYKNYTTTWKDVCKTIYKSSSFGKELEKKNYYKDELTNLIKTSKNDFEKASLIFNFIKSKIKWNKYQSKYTDLGVKKAYKDGVGNSAEINLILTSMLRQAGLDANPVLVSTKSNGVPLFPTREGFNYVISKVNFPNEKYILLDATEKYSHANILPSRTLNWYGKEIFKDGVSKDVNLIPSLHTKNSNILYVKIGETGSIEGMYRKALTGHLAMFYRQKNNLKKDESQINSLEEKYNIEIDEFKVLNKKALNKPISQSIKFTGDSYIEEINNKLYFSPLFFLAMTENPFKTEERNFPVDYGMPWLDSFTISITIPEGYTIESHPKELAIGLPDNLGVFKYKISILGNKVKLSSITQINSNIISPQYYSSLKLFYKQLVEKQTEKIVLVKKAKS